MSRYSPHRVRPAYQAEMSRLPLPVENMPAFGHPDDPDVGLPVLATREVERRRIEFALIVGRPAFLLSFTHAHHEALGHVIGLDSPTPVLSIADARHLEWAQGEGITATILDIARFTWHHRHRLLEERLTR